MTNRNISDTKINYSFSKTHFGQIIVASTKNGICRLAFYDNKKEALSGLKKLFPKADLIESSHSFHKQALELFSQRKNSARIEFDLHGTPFQIEVWETLSQLPFGSIATYAQIAQSIGRPKAVRAVGTAIGKNPVCFLIPCHRVIQSSGALGNYRWGTARKQAMLEWEAAQVKGII